MSKTIPSNKDLRIFELIWAMIFLGIAIYPNYQSFNLDNFSLETFIQTSRIWALYISGFFVLTALIYPRLLTYFYIVWVKFGEFIGGIISKIILFILFYLLFAPIGIFFRIIRKDLLHQKLDAKATSYWVRRKMQPGTMKNQY
ncbi:MAG: hypothetical protein IME94_09085 [Proteobacteria bacterium]|nr:hypothetical protein [Pseudomonadota bacterium]